MTNPTFEKLVRFQRPELDHPLETSPPSLRRLTVSSPTLNPLNPVTPFS